MKIKWETKLASIENNVYILIRRPKDNIKKEQRKTNYNDQKQHKQIQLSTEKTIARKQKWGKKAFEWIFQDTNKKNPTQEDIDMAKKGKP